MRSVFLFGLAALTAANAAHISTNAQCGTAAEGRTCKDSRFGDCCSQYNWCGSTSAYCGKGCNPLFGTCTSTASTLLTVTRSSATPSRASSAATPSATVKVSKNARCGNIQGATGGFSCLGSKWGNCCSRWGYCGSTSDYCAVENNCQPGFGKCTGGASSSVRSSASTAASSSAVSSSSASISSTSSASMSSPTFSSASMSSSASPSPSPSSSALSSDVVSSTSSVPQSSSSPDPVSSSLASSSTPVIDSSTPVSTPVSTPTPSPATCIASLPSICEVSSSGELAPVLLTVNTIGCQLALNALLTPNPAASCFSPTLLSTLTGQDFGLCLSTSIPLCPTTPTPSPSPIII